MKAAQALLSGSRVKATLEAADVRNPGRVRIDWLRFTASLDAIVAACPALPLDLDALALMSQPARDVARMARAVDDGPATTACGVSRAGACWIVERLCIFEVGVTEARGMDYYTARTALMFSGECVGWVLAGGRSWAQASTVHFNLFGGACLRLTPDRLAVLREWCEVHSATITRVDLALDIWHGFDISTMATRYLSGEFDVRGKRPSQREIGSWTLGHSRTFEVGSRGTGKLCRIYEKGHELFGHESGDPWVRVEVEIRNNHRIIDLDVLINPAQYFAGSYTFCREVLSQCVGEVEARTIKTIPGLVDKTVDAAVQRVARWVKRTAAPALCAMLSFGGDILDQIVGDEAGRDTRRLRGFQPGEIRAAFDRLTHAYAPHAAPAT